VIFIGNQLNKNAQMATGAEVVKMLSTIRADLCFLGTNAIEAGAGITDSSWEVVEVKKAMIQATDKLVSMVIAEKLNTIQPMQVCGVSDIDTLITELPADHELLVPYHSKGIRLL
jgi:DeoR/GlpR family transcriptional regulator of sugar metabolism